MYLYHRYIIKNALKIQIFTLVTTNTYILQKYKIYIIKIIISL